MIGIDKIQVWTPLENLRVKDANHSLFGYNCNTRQGSGEVPHLLTDSKGKKVFANSIYHNSNLAQYSINSKGMQIQFNPSKALHPYNLTATGKEFKGIVSAVGKELKGIGIHADLATMRLVRFDLAKQAEMANPFYSYTEAFRMLKAKRTKEQRQYPNGYLLGNTRWQTIGYDKKQELAEHHLVIPENNLMRLENRWMKNKVIAEQFRLDTLPALSSLAPSELNAVYVHHLQARVFPKRYEGEQMVFDFESEVQQMKFFADNFSRGWFIKYLSVRSIEQILLGFGGTENLRKALLEIVPKQTASDLVRQCQELLGIKAQMDAAGSRQTVSTLLYEMQERFAA